MVAAVRELKITTRFPGTNQVRSATTADGLVLLGCGGASIALTGVVINGTPEASGVSIIGAAEVSVDDIRGNCCVWVQIFGCVRA